MVKQNCFLSFLKKVSSLSLIYFWLNWVFIAVHAFSSCGEQGLLFIAVHGLLTAAASLAVEHRLRVHGLEQVQHSGSALQLAGSGALAQQLRCTGLVARSTWDPPGPGIKSVSPALAAGFLSTEPPGSPQSSQF